MRPTHSDVQRNEFRKTVRLRACVAGFVLAAMLLSACATPPRGDTMLVPGERVNMRDVSFQPPVEHPWHVLKRTPYETGFAAPGSGQDETFAVQASYFELPAVDSMDELFAIFETKLRTEVSPRFSLLGYELTPQKFQGLECAEFYLDYEDRQAQKFTDREDPMRLRVVSLYCLHPWEENVGLNLAYSNRHYEGDGEADLRDKALKMFETLRFEKEGQ